MTALTPTSDAPPRLTGKLVHLHNEGYGFIRAAGTQEEYFVLRSHVPASLWLRNARLDFDTAPPAGPRKAPRAVNITAPAELADPQMEVAS